MLEIETETKPSPCDLTAFLPYACKHLCQEFDLKITVVVEEEYVNKMGSGDIKNKKSTINLKKGLSMVLHSATSAVHSSIATEQDSESGDQAVRMICVLASTTRAIVAIELDRNRAVPRELMCVLRLCVPYNPQLTRFSARWSKLEPAVLLKLSALLPHGNISDVRLDNTHVRGCDCRELLDAGRLRRLSLARCQLGDEGCTAVAEALVFPRPASHTLTALTLAGNAIGDAGALALARALRSNRTLRLLDLADNQLRDEGALAILRTLTEFPLTLEEILAGRRLRTEHALRYAEALRHAEELQRSMRSVRVVRPGAAEVRRRAVNEEAAAAAAMAARNLSPPLDPFPPEETVLRGGHTHSHGNTVLNYLNLAYNSLSVVSVRALLNALQGQAARAAGGGGLVRVLLVGNPLPTHAPEYEACAALMERALSALTTTKTPQQLKKKVVSKKTIVL